MKKWLVLALLTFIAPLAAEIKVVAIAGSTREGAYSKKLAKQAAAMATQLGAKVTFVDLRDYPMPLYDADVEAAQGMPESAQRLRRLILESQAIIITTPQYNDSIPAVLKNAIDWISRTEDGKRDHHPLTGRKIALMSTSPGKKGGTKALVHLKDIIGELDGTIVKQTVSVGNASTAFSAEGELTNPELKKKLKKEIQLLLSTEK